MKKLLTIAGLLCVLSAAPVYAVVQGQDGDVPVTNRTTTQTRTSYGENAEGIRQRIQDLKTERAELKEKRRLETAEAAKKVATKRIENLIKRYNAMVTRIEKMSSIDAEQKALVTTKIKAQIANLEALKAELASAKTVDEVKAVMAKVKEQAKKGQELVKEVVAAIHASHYTKVAERLLEILAKLEPKATTPEMDKMVISIKAKIDTAKVNITEKKFDEARKNLQSARLEMVKLAGEIKKAGNSTTNTESN